jgi:aminoglycoside phosphotransferase family enzyme
MTKQQISGLLAEGVFPGTSKPPELVETHISWVFKCEHFVYKIKKPIQYSFLDFSTMENRKFYCEREIALNRRLTEDIYLGVQTITEKDGCYFVGGEKGEIIDYTVQMRRMCSERQMDFLLKDNQVSKDDIFNLAVIAGFHKNARIIFEKNYLDIQRDFNDLRSEMEFLQSSLDIDSDGIITHSIASSGKFLEAVKSRLANRVRAGFFRDCHGDLHSRNIFLLPAPQPFDCIEFNDDFRRIDVLNEVAFLCMDLDAFGRKDLSDAFIDDYNGLFPCMTTDEDRGLFVFYKAYRSNVRAKVNSLRARTAIEEADRMNALSEAKKYLLLMENYVDQLDGMY